jgi:hypothetical protein
MKNILFVIPFVLSILVLISIGMWNIEASRNARSQKKVESLEYINRELSRTIYEQQYLVTYYSNRWEISMKMLESYRSNP